MTFNYLFLFINIYIFFAALQKKSVLKQFET